MAIKFIGDAVQYFGFNKQVLVQTKKEMHAVVNCRMSVVHCSQTILYVSQTILYVTFCLPGV
jgi:hypothetical protein